MAIGDMLAIESNGLARTQSRGGQFFLLEIRPSLRFSIYASDVNVIIFIPEKGRGEKEIGYWIWTVKPEKQAKKKPTYSHK